MTDYIPELTPDGLIIAFLNALNEKPGVVIPDDDVGLIVSQAMGEALHKYGLEPGQTLTS